MRRPDVPAPFDHMFVAGPFIFTRGEHVAKELKELADRLRTLGYDKHMHHMHLGPYKTLPDQSDDEDELSAK